MKTLSPEEPQYQDSVANGADPATEPEPVATTEGGLPEEAQQVEQQVPLGVALLQQTRRVREQVLPAYYALRYHPQEAVAGSNGVAAPGGGAPKVNPELAIILMNGALTTAEQAMMNQDMAQMVFAHQQLATYGV